MSKQVRLRRGTTAQHASFTGALGEVTVDTDKGVTVVHDGSTAGGIPSARQDRPRGWTRTQYFTTAGSATYTTTGKTDLKRLRVTCYGGGGGGSNASGGGGGGGGGAAVRVLDISEITSTVTVTVGAGGGVNAAGGSSSFGAYVAATGGAAGAANTSAAGGSGSGSGAIVFGGQGGQSGSNWGYGPYFVPQGESGFNPGVAQFIYPGSGGGLGGGGPSQSGKGIYGGGGGFNAVGSSGSVVVEEIYGLV
jgi:hypothetical protein